MTFDELADSLPNGLHDAELIALEIDYRNETASVVVNIDMGLLTEGPEYRRGRLRFSGVQFVSIDPPCSEERSSSPSRIDAGSGQPATAPCSLPDIAPDKFLCWLFVENWNGFVRIAARSVSLDWTVADQ